MALVLSRKREWLARGLLFSGATGLLWRLPSKDSLLVLNYHRIANANDDPFDPDLITATPQEFDRQLSYLKPHVSFITLEEALAFVDGTIEDKTPRFRVLITFDDGYLDNYQTAFPILKSHGVPGLFFLVTGMVGSCYIPWWDHVAYLLKTAQRRRFCLKYPQALNIDMDQNGVKESIARVVQLYKKPENTDSARFLRELKEEARGEDPPRIERRFLNWTEAREMLAANMSIGSHTHTHPMLSQLKPEEQRSELAQSRKILSERLDIDVRSLAYPFGGVDHFSDETQKLAEEAGYRVAFSFHGGINRPQSMRRYDLKRIGPEDQTWVRFQTASAICNVVGAYWP